MNKQANLMIFLSFIVATIATLGSLFFSEIMDFVPCSMCWYQRIFMYPLVIVLLVNILYPDDKVFKYSLSISLVGLAFSIYHNLLMFKIISPSMVPCRSGIPCSTEYINWFGFVTIPFLSLIAYSLITLFLLIGYKESKNGK